MHYLIDSPVSFINGVTPFEAHFVIFCAVWLPWITIAWVLVYLLYRPIPNKSVFAPFENMAVRLRQILIVSISAIVADLSSIVLKNYFKIGRPATLNFDLHPLLSLSGYGFPSSHAAVFSAIAAALFLIYKRSGTFAILLALVIGTARVLAGVHTPLDILGGYLLGTLVAVVVDFVAVRQVAK